LRLTAIRRGGGLGGVGCATGHGPAWRSNTPAKVRDRRGVRLLPN